MSAPDSRSHSMAWLLSTCAGIFLVLSWWTPSSPIGSALAWCSLPFLVCSLSISYSIYLRTFLAGLLAYCGGFYWLYSTIADFGGFPFPAAASIFALFVFGSAVQFLFLAFTWRHLPQSIHRLGLRTPLAWLAAQQLWIRIFPWDFGHTQIGFLPFAQIADIGGVWLVTFIMMWVAEAFTLRKVVFISGKILASLSLILSLTYGLVQISDIPNGYGKPLRTVMVQGNVSMERKHDQQYFSVNREQYLKLSSSVAGKDTLVIWPESTITDFIPAQIPHARNSQLIPYLGDGSAFLIGGLTYLSRSEFFNSSMLVRPDGSIAPPYHKIVLMPFGEYTPLGNILPFIKEINSTAGQFTPGTGATALEFSLSDGTPIRVTPLICYEDIVPSLAREGVLKGGEVLVNQTNDAWFGDTVAASQHHMIATFRAIENRRFLLRSTNTGLTAVVDPVGRTLAALPSYSEGTLDMTVNLLSKTTIYTILGVEKFWWWFGFGSLLLALFSRTRVRASQRGDK